jgi:hypothetical protein
MSAQRIRIPRYCSYGAFSRWSTCRVIARRGPFVVHRSLEYRTRYTLTHVATLSAVTQSAPSKTAALTLASALLRFDWSEVQLASPNGEWREWHDGVPFHVPLKRWPRWWSSAARIRKDFTYRWAVGD